MSELDGVEACQNTDGAAERIAANTPNDSSRMHSHAKATSANSGANSHCTAVLIASVNISFMFLSLQLLNLHLFNFSPCGKIIPYEECEMEGCFIFKWTMPPAFFARQPFYILSFTNLSLSVALQSITATAEHLKVLGYRLAAF